MRRLSRSLIPVPVPVLLALIALIALTAGCRENRAAAPDGAIAPDAAMPDAAALDAGPDGSSTDSDGIAEARAATDGAGLSLAIHDATITYLKPLIGSASSDPAGFTIQAVMPGPALFVAVDPATIVPAPAVGDVVSFTITEKRTFSAQPRAMRIASYTRSATGRNVGALTQSVSDAGDVVSYIASYDSELITVSGALVDDFPAAGTGFVRAHVATAGVPGDANFQLRVPQALVGALDMVPTCRFTATRVPMGQFNTQAQIGAFAAGDITLQGCPPPLVVSAIAASTQSVRITLSRNIKPSSVSPDGSQFIFDNGLTASGATVNGRTITLTTSAQDPATLYSVTIASTVTDLQGSSIVPATDSFAGFALGSGAGLSRHTTLGIPSPSSTTDPNSYLSVKSEYVLSYNSGRKVANWVSWELNTAYLGSVDRQDDYRPDDTLPTNLPQAQLADYSGSGYQRGHMCPSADRTLTDVTNSQTFYLTNMVPQAGNNNQGPWADLEIVSRSLARTGKELFVISGGTFSASSNTIGAGVVVPDMTYKVVVVLDAVGQGPESVTASTRVIAVLMPNENALIGMNDDWRIYRVSVDTIEAMTGLDFLSDVDPAVQAVVEARVDNL
jgi:endonuclease G, mitochondrial